jgi:DNA-binding beta-propeller fold protein YncE
MSRQGRALPVTRGSKTMQLVAVVALVLSGACTAEPPEAHNAQRGSAPAATDEVDLPIDVAGHLAIAARTDMQPLRGVWRWDAVPVGIAVGQDGSVYWTQYRTNTIEGVDREGTHAETVAAVDGPLGLAFDRTRGQLFYVSDRHYPRSIGSLRLGGKPEMLIFGTRVNRPFAIALAERSSQLYWTESINGRIRSADTDGRDFTTLFDDGIASADEKPGAVALGSVGVAVDEQRGLIFWSDLRTATIMRARLDGSERRIILGREQGLDFPTGLAIDAAGGKLYWADPGTETIGRADFNGLYPEIVVSAADAVLEPYGLAVDAERRLLYWTDVARNGLYRTSLDDQQVERFVDLDASSAQTPPAAGACEDAVVHARREFLRRWVKLVRTCVVDVSATKAVMRSPNDLRLAAGTCGRQLALAHDIGPLRRVLEPHCNAQQVAAAIDDILKLGAEIVAADLPPSTLLLRQIRPFVAGLGSAETASVKDALAALDELVERLQRFDRAPPSTIAWTLPASGQTTSYAALTQLAHRATAVPDDGAIRAGTALAYVDNGDGTISDRNTGLMWEKKCAGCGGLHDFNTRYPWRSPKGETDVAGWLVAINAEDGRGFGGHDDWRLPEIGELLGIVNYEHFNPAVSSAFDGSGCGLDCRSLDAPECSCTHLGAYWTAGNSPHPDDIVPVVAFHLGLVWGQSTGDGAFVRAVRGPRPERRQPRFVDNGDGTITDRVTRLMWEKKCGCPGDLHDSERRMYWSYDGMSETIWDWLSAVNSEGGRGFAGHGDWRIPNIKELFSLFDGTRRDPSMDPIFVNEGCAEVRNPRCTATAKGMHWTSTTFADFPALSVAVGFGTPGPLEREPPPWVIRVVGGVEPHEKTLRMVTRAVRGPVPATP